MANLMIDGKTLSDFLQSDLLREVVLKSEIDALLHDLDKMSVDFLMSMAEGAKNTEYSHHKLYEAKESPEKLQVLKKLLGNFWECYFSGQYEIPLNKLELNNIYLDQGMQSKLPAQNSYLGECAFSHHKQLKSGTFSVLAWIINSSFTACDGLDSKYDKGATGKQKPDFSYIANPFGYEFLCFSPTVLTQLETKRKQFLNDIATCLERDKEQWHECRDEILHNAGRDFGEGYFRLALGETQRSANDVFLFDHVFSVSAMLKTMLVRVIVESKICRDKRREYFIPLDANHVLDNQVAVSSWKVFSIALNSQNFLYHARKIGEVKGFFDEWQKACNDIRQKLETDIPVAAELYRDLHGIHFLVPRFDIPQLPDESTELASEFEALITTQAKKIVTQSQFFTCKTKIFESGKTQDGKTQDSKSKDGLLELGRAISWAQRDAFVFPQESDNLAPWMLNPGTQETDLCQCCRQRCQNRYKLGYCDVCYELRQGRATDWYKQGQNSTIWLNELSDSHSQIALVSLKFDLSQWLNGKEIKSLLVDNPYTEESIFKSLFYGHLFNAIQAIMANKLDNSKGVKFLSYISLGTSEELRKFATQHNIPPENAGLLRKKILQLTSQNPQWLTYLRSLFTKYPSMARIRRVWTSTQLFFEEILRDLQSQNLLPAQPRLKFQACLLNANDSHLLENSDSTQIKIGSVSMEVYIHNSGEHKYEILSQENLRKIFAEEDNRNILQRLQEKLDRGEFVIKVKAEAEKNCETQEVAMCNADEIALSTYTPIVDIAITPQLFQFLCPADRVNDILQFVYGKYTHEMSKVRDRLPLHANVVYFKNKYPLYVAMETAHQMLSDEYLRSKQDKEPWLVVKTADANSFEYSAKTGQKEYRKSKARRLTLQSPIGFIYDWDVDIMTGDSDLKDDFYPNFEAKVASKEARMEFAHPDYPERHYVHVQELQEGDKVLVQSSTFDVIFVDSNEARFLVQGEKRRHSMIEEGRKAYYLDDLKIFERVWKILDQEGYSQTQLEKLQALLCQKRSEWNLQWLEAGANLENMKHPVNYFIRSLLLHPNQFKKYFEKDSKKQEDYSFLHKVCHNGMIFDIIEYYCRLCGKKIQGERKANSNSQAKEVSDHDDSK